MKRIFLLFIQITIINFCSGQQKNDSPFVKEFLNNFNLCQLPYNTKDIDKEFGSFEKKYKKISKAEILKYISKNIDEIGYDYVSHNSDNFNDSVYGFAEFDYNYICQFNLNKYQPVLYIKSDPIDSLSVYLANYSSTGKCLDKLIIHCFRNDEEARKGIINADFTIKIWKYEPIDNFQKAKITIYHYKLNLSTGMFDKLSEVTKIGEKDFHEYLFSKVDLPDDPINQ